MTSVTKPATKHFAMFCSYCKAKGLPESVFTSHFVKDAPGKDGKVCCPELLKNECGYCHDAGHTPAHCPKLKARDTRRKTHAKRITHRHGARMSAPRSANGGVPSKQTNLFEALSGYSTPEKPKEAFPPLPGAPKKSKKAPQGIWGAANTLTIVQLEKILAEKRLMTISASEQAFIDEQIEKTSQTLGETAEGEAFFDNDLDAEEAVTAIARTESPLGLALAGVRVRILGVPAALPANCDLDADFGPAHATDWGDDALGMNVVMGDE